MPSSARAAKQNPGRASPAKGRKSSSPAKSSRGRDGLKLPAAFKDLGPIASGAFSTIIKARHVESGAVIAVKAFKCKSDTEAAERDRELDVLRIVSEVGHARKQMAKSHHQTLPPLEFDVDHLLLLPIVWSNRYR